MPRDCTAHTTVRWDVQSLPESMTGIPYIMKQNKKNPKKRVANVKSVSKPMPALYGNSVFTGNYSVQSIGDDVVRVRGQELLGAVNAGSRSWGFFDVNPTCWANSRLSLLAQTYERYRYNGFRIKYVPMVGTTSAGAVSVYFDPDPLDSTPQINSDTDAMAHIMQQRFSVTTPVGLPSGFAYKRAAKDQAWFRCTLGESTDYPAVSQGQIVTYTSSGTLTAGILLIEYDLEFMYPQLERGDGGLQFTISSPVFTPVTTGSSVSVVGGLSGSTAAAGDVYLCRVYLDPSVAVGVSLGSSTVSSSVKAGQLLWAATYATGASTVTTFFYRSIADALSGSGNPMTLQSGTNVQINLMARKLFSASGRF